MEVPPKLSGTSPLVPWLNRLREATQSALINSVVNGRYSRGPGGTQLICSPGQNPNTGTLVYIKACLEDGTEAYVPLLIYGKIYALATGTGYVTPTIDSGAVPDNSKLLQ